MQLPEDRARRAPSLKPPERASGEIRAPYCQLAPVSRMEGGARLEMHALPDARTLYSVQLISARVPVQTVTEHDLERECRARYRSVLTDFRNSWLGPYSFGTAQVKLVA